MNTERPETATKISKKQDGGEPGTSIRQKI
jgi:hypothetical protein